MSWHLKLALVVVCCEIATLVAAEKYTGIKRIRGGVDPREGEQPGQALACAWLLGVAVTRAYPACLLFDSDTRFFGFAMLSLCVAGHELRRRCPFKWTLVVLTFEGALRIGVIVHLFVSSFTQGR